MDYLLSTTTAPTTVPVSGWLANLVETTHSSSSASVDFLKKLLTGVFQVQQDSPSYILEKDEVLRLEEHTIDLGYVDNFGSQITHMTGIMADATSPHKERLEKTIDFFRTQKSRLETYNSRTASKSTLIALNHNINDYLTNITSLLINDDDIERQQNRNCHQILMDDVEKLLIDFSKREVHRLRNLVMLLGNTNHLMDVTTPTLKKQPIRLFNFIYLARMWLGSDILITNHQIEVINTFLMRDVSSSPYANTYTYTDRINTLSEKFFDNRHHSYLDKASYRLQLLQSILDLFKSVSEVFAKQILEVVMHIHASTEMYTSVVLSKQ